MTRPSFTTYLDHLRSDSARFRDVLATCDPAARVPACPEWDAADLLWHLAEVQAFWAANISTRPASPDESGTQPPDRPDTYAGLLDLYDACSGSLVEALEAADPSEPAWSWAAHVPDGQTVGFTYRRQAHEALVHRLDAEQTAGVAPTPFDADLAADGVAELVEVMYGGAPPAWATFTPGHLVAVDLTDVGRRILVRTGHLQGTDPDSGYEADGPHLVVVTDGGDGGDGGGAPEATVAGAAAVLDTWLWSRADDTGVTITGADDAAADFRRAVSESLD